jgi:hypothetical protein
MFARCALTRVLRFISESSGEILLFSFQQKCKWSTEAIQGVCRLVDALNLSTKVEILKDYCCRRCTESKNQILEVFERFPQGVHAGVPLRLESQVKAQKG